MALLHIVDCATLAISRTTREPDIQSAVDKVRSTFDAEHCGTKSGRRRIKTMSTLVSRTAALSVVFASFRLGAAFAQELPNHVLFQRSAPLPAEASDGVPNSEPLDNWFGADVAIRDGFAFAGMPKTNATGQVAVFTQQGTSGHWTRTATIVASAGYYDRPYTGQIIYRRISQVSIPCEQVLYSPRHPTNAFRKFGHKKAAICVLPA